MEDHFQALWYILIKIYNDNMMKYLKIFIMIALNAKGNPRVSRCLDKQLVLKKEEKTLIGLLIKQRWVNSYKVSLPAKQIED